MTQTGLIILFGLIACGFGLWASLMSSGQSEQERKDCDQPKTLL